MNAVLKNVLEWNCEKKADLSNYYIVNIFIKASNKNLDEISKFLKIPYSKGSCNKGDKVIKGPHRGGKKKKTVWLFDVDGKLGLEKQMEEIISIFDSSFFSKGGKLPKNWEVTLDIGVVYKTFTCSIKIADKYLKWLGDKKIELEVSSYPGNFPLSEKPNQKLPIAEKYEFK